MRKLFCCHKGESSKGVEEAEEQTQPLQPSSQSVQNPHASTSLSIIDENEVIFDENLFDGNEGLNLAWRNLWKSYEDAKGFFLSSSFFVFSFFKHSVFRVVILPFENHNNAELASQVIAVLVFRTMFDLGFLFIILLFLVFPLFLKRSVFGFFIFRFESRKPYSSRTVVTRLI